MSWYNRARDPTHQLPGGEERSTRELSVGKMCLWRLGPYPLSHWRLSVPRFAVGVLLPRLLLHARCDARKFAGSSACCGCVDLG